MPDNNHVGVVKSVELLHEAVPYESVPLVSVLILTYNNIEGIFSTLDSVFKQAYPAIEIIVSDDASKDFSGSCAEVERYIANHSGSNIVRAVINAIESNVGTVKNTNDALDLVNGEYAISLASEDVLIESDVLLDYVAFMDAQPELDVCFGKLRGVLPDGTYRCELLACDTDYEKLTSFSRQDTLNHLYRRNFLPAPAAFIRMDAYEKFGRHDEDIRLIEDYPFWLAASLQGARFGYMDKYTVDYMLTGVSSAGSYSEQFIADLQLVYDKYIFPNDVRFGVAQGAYNNIKRYGLSFYMAKARWDDFSRAKRIAASVAYAPLFVFTGLQNGLNELKNRRVK